MRATLHLVTADDCLLPTSADAAGARRRARPPSRLRPRRWLGVDLTPVLDFARTFLAERARTGTELRDAFAARFPDLDAPALAYACRNRLAFVQVPPRGVWGRSAQVTSTTAEAWLGRPLDRRSLDRRRRAPLPRRVRSGDGRRRLVVVAADRDARGGRAAAAAACGPSSTSGAASCSTCPTRLVPIPTRRHRRGSSPSTTTCCCRTPTGPVSCARTGAASRGPPAPSTAPCSTTAPSPGRGTSSAIGRAGRRRS